MTGDLFDDGGGRNIISANVTLPLEIRVPGIYPGIPADVYHADPVPSGSLSSTGAKRLLAPHCPAKFRWEQDHPRRSDAFDLGNLAHQLVLGDSEDRVVEVDAADWRTKAAQAAKEAAHAANRIPVLTKQIEAAREMALAVFDHPTAGRLIGPGMGEPESSLFWVDQQSGIWMRCRPDFIPHDAPGRQLLVDYKTTSKGGADPDTFARTAMNLGYHQQDDFYRAGAKAVGLDDDPGFLFVVQEIEAPYLVTVIELDETAQHIGWNLNRQAIDVFDQCRRSGSWPGYAGDEIAHVSLPGWYARQFDEND